MYWNLDHGRSALKTGQFERKILGYQSIVVENDHQVDLELYKTGNLFEVLLIG